MSSSGTESKDGAFLDCKLEIPKRAAKNGVFEPSPSKTENDVINCGAGYCWRHLQILLMFSLIVVSHLPRVSLSVGVVAMTTQMTPDQEVFPWSREQQGTILGSFLWGYGVAQIPSGYLATRFGAKRLLGLSLIFSSVLLMSIPLVSRQWDWIGLVVIRTCTGLVQGIVYPGCIAILGKWTLPSERGIASACTFTAQPTGSFLGIALSGVIAQFLGWQLIFYIFGGINLVFAVVWSVFAADTPEEHSYISDSERNYICGAIGKESRAPTGSIPWCSIFTSIPMISTILAGVGYTWCLWFTLAVFPTYLNDIFEFSMSMNGVVSGAPFLLTALLGPLFGLLASMMIQKGWTTTTLTRKWMNTLGSWVPAIMFLLVNFTPYEYKIVTIVELTVAIGFMAGIYSGYVASFVDLSPRYGGLLFAITNFVSSLTSAVAPPSVGALVDNLGQDVGWSASFYLSAGIAFFTNLFYITFGSAEQQPWNDDGVKQSKPESTHEPTEIGCENQAYNPA